MVSLAEALYISKEIFEPLLRAPSGSTSPTTENARTDRPDRAALTAASMGGLAAAFLASMCCVGPLVFAALGVGVGATGFLAGTAGFLKALLPYRPFFIGLTVLMLGLSLYLAYQKPKAVCLPSSVCAPQGGGRSRTMLWVIAVIALVLVLAPYWLALF